MIGPVIDAALPVMRANAESMMLDRCTIERATSTWNEAAQKTVTTWAPVITESVCDVDDGAASGRSIVTDETVTRVEPSVYLPASVVGVEPDESIEEVVVSGVDTVVVVARWAVVVVGAGSLSELTTPASPVTTRTTAAAAAASAITRGANPRARAEPGWSRPRRAPPAPAIGPPRRAPAPTTPVRVHRPASAGIVGHHAGNARSA